MRPIEHYERFAQAFCQASEQAGKEQYLVPYFITGHPGSTMKDTIELGLWLKAKNMRPRQVQDFIPTPMAIAMRTVPTVMITVFSAVVQNWLSLNTST